VNLDRPIRHVDLNPIFMNTSTAWHGQIELKFNRLADNSLVAEGAAASMPTGTLSERTILSHSYARAPLKVQRPFYPEPDLCQTVLLHSAGGMVGGDQLSYHIDLAPASRALITTAAATKIYRSQGEISHQQIEINIGTNACLEWLPQETIIFNQAKYQQDLRVNLAPGATFCAWEIIRLGRSASQETFNQGCWQNTLEVWQQDKPLWIDRQRLMGEQWNSLQAANSQPILGLFTVIGRPVTTETIEQARALAPKSLQGLEYGATALKNGIVCRYRGSDRAAGQQWFIALWNLMRQQYLDRPACIPRVWQQ
jgi:urease accessory protein